MQVRTLFFAKADIYNVIRSVGGEWNDSKERPLVCCFQSLENPKLYYAIPIGNFNHRTPQAIARINSYISRDPSDISSCYYHIGNTDIKSIFFISDVIPITDKYFDREYLNKYSNNVQEIKNQVLINDLERKLNRILAYENGNPNFFRQHITDVKAYLINELNNENN